MSVVAKSSIWFIICGFFQRGISVITTPIFTRLLTTEEYGVYSIFNSWLEILTIFATLKLGYGVFVQGLVKYSDDKERFSSSLLALATVWWSVALIIYLLFREFWNGIFGISTLLMICMFIMMISTVAYNFWAAQQRNEYKYITLVRLTIITSILKPALGIIAVLCFKSNKVEARIITLTLVELVIYAVLYFKIAKKGKKFFDKAYWKYALAFNLPLVPHFLSQVILNHSDRIMIKQLVGYEQAGIYSLAYSLAMILTILNTSIMNSMRPWTFQRLKAGEEDKIESVGLGSLIIVGICNIILISFAPEIVHIFSPASYDGAINLIAPITMGVFFIFIYNLFVDIQMYYEKTNSIMIVAIICAVVNIGSNYVLIKQFGYIAAAYTTLGSYILMSILHYLAMKIILKRSKVNKKIYSVKKVLMLSAAFIIFSIIMSVLANYLLVRIIIITIVLGILGIKRKAIKGIINTIVSSKKKKDIV